MELYFHSINEGHCQVNFWTKNQEGEKIYYGFQEYSKGLVRFMRLTQDGEPQGEATPKKDSLISVDELLGNSELLELVRGFIKTHKNFHFKKGLKNGTYKNNFFGR